VTDVDGVKGGHGGVVAVRELCEGVAARDLELLERAELHEGGRESLKGVAVDECENSEGG
jgi:hypothetical protein